jgi:hypothetical protein
VSYTCLPCGLRPAPTMAIAQLPDEILEHVFLAARNSLAKVDHGPFAFASADFIPLWKALTHSTRRWRLVAIECAALWAIVSYSTTTAAWVSAALQRAREAPLSVSASRLEDIQPNSTYLLSLISRIDKVDILSLKTSDSRRDISLGSLLAPRLRHLELCNSDSSWPVVQWPSPEMFVEPFPPLLTLKLHTNLSFLSPLLRCSSITELDLTHPNHRAVRCSVSLLAHILSYLPLLVHLTLRAVCASAPDEHESPPAQLPCLRTMHVADCAPFLQGVMSYVDPRVWDQQTPPKLCVQENLLTGVRIGIPEQISYLSEMAASLVSFRQAWSQRIDAVHIEVHEDCFWSIHLSSGIPRTVWMVLQIRCANSQRRTPSHAFFALASLFDNTSEMFIRESAPGNAHVSSTQWTEIFQHFPNAKYVSVSGPCSHAIIHAIIGYEAEICDPLPGWPGDDPETTGCLLQITELEVRDTEIDASEIESLAMWTRTRAESGMKLRRICILDVCANASKRVVEEAREVVQAGVDVVQWEVQV